MASSKPKSPRIALVTLACIVLAAAAFMGVLWALVHAVVSGEAHLEDFVGQLDETAAMTRAEVEGWFGDGWAVRGRSEGWMAKEVEPSAIPVDYEFWHDGATHDGTTVVRYSRLGVEAYMIYDEQGTLELFIDAN